MWAPGSRIPCLRFEAPFSQPLNTRHAAAIPPLAASRWTWSPWPANGSRWEDPLIRLRRESVVPAAGSWSRLR